VKPQITGASSVGFLLATEAEPCSSSTVAETKEQKRPENDRKAEAEAIRLFVGRLIEEGKAKEFLVEHGFLTPGGRLPKRYGG
jgi:hypothetical protein